MDKEPPVPAEPGMTITEDDKTWALLAHLSILVVSVIGPLVIWLIKKDNAPFVEDQAKEALNFQLSVLLVVLVSGATCVLSPLAVVAAVGGTVYAIIAAVEAYKGTLYRYPYTFRMIH